MIPAVMAFSMVLSAPANAAILTDANAPGPGNPYDQATTDRIRDNVLEYDEIEMLIDTYNQTLKSMRERYNDAKDSYKTSDRMKENYYNMAGTLADTANTLQNLASMLEQGLSYPGMADPKAYADAVYNAENMALLAEQTEIGADAITTVTPDMMKLKMVDGVRAQLISGAETAMVGYEQLLLGKEKMESSIALLEEVYKSTELQASQGLATQNDVLAAKQQLESVQANRINMEATEIKIRQSLCSMMGWEYNGTPEIRNVPETDLTRIDRMNPEADKETAIANNFTLRYNQLDYENTTDGSVQQATLERTIKEQKETISATLTNLYNTVIQEKNEYETAVAALELERTKMEAAERKMQVGTIGRLQYLQQKNAYDTKAIDVKMASLDLFQAMETYDWALKGNLSIS